MATAGTNNLEGGDEICMCAVSEERRAAIWRAESGNGVKIGKILY